MLRSIRTHRALLLAASLAAASLSHTASAANKFWDSGYGTWSHANHWSPSAPTSADIAWVGYTAAAHDESIILDVNPTLAGLYVSDGMTIQAQSDQITINGDLTLTGDNFDNGTGSGHTTRVYFGHNFLAPYDVKANTINILDGADFVMNGAYVNVMNSMNVGATGNLHADGVLNFFGNSPTVFTLDGELNFTTFGGGDLTLNQLGTGRFDLDGGVVHDNTIKLAGGADLTVNADQLADSFDDSIWVNGGSKLKMNLANGWSLGSTGGIALFDGISSSESHLTGSTLTINGGRLEAVGGWYDRVNAIVDAPVVLNSGTIHVDDGTMTMKKNLMMNGGEIHAYSQDGIQFDAPVVINAGQVEMKDWYGAATFNSTTTVNGGSFITYDLSDIVFNGTTTINAGTFTSDFRGEITFKGPTKVFGGTFNGVETYTGMYFNGPTEYANTINMTGEVLQNGAVTVNNPATINAEQIDMDGAAAITVWNINAPLTINAQRIADNSNNVFTGQLNLVSTPASPGTLRINLPGGGSWTMSGGLNITGSGFGTVTDVIAGSDVNISGPTKVSFDNAVSARVNFTSFNGTTINTASSLRLDGGNLASVNTIKGATIQGPGTLKSSANHALWGHGTINAAVAFAGGDLRADGGTLNLNGPISSVGVIGAQAGGTLKFASQFNTNIATRLELNGGTVTGANILNNKETRGIGAITAAGFVNNGSINVSNGSLVLNTTASPDLDGTAETGDVFIVGGQMYVPDPLTDDFNGVAALGAGGAMLLNQGWTLGSGGLLSMQGSLQNSAVLVAPSQTIAGTVTMPTNALGRFAAKTTFAPGSSTTIPALSRLDLYDDGTISQGATFTGAGTLRNMSTAKLTLMHNSNVATRIQNDGTIQLGSLFSALASADSFTQTSTGVLQMDLFGATPGAQFDKLNVAQSMNLDGVLTLAAGFYNPAYGLSHEILHSGGTRSGVFTNVNGVALSPTKYLAVTYDADSVNVTAALPGDANLDGTVDIADFATLAANFNLTGTWADGSFDGNLNIDIGDFALLGGNFNASVPMDLPRGAPVPEPAVCGLAMLSSLLARRRRG